MATSIGSRIKPEVVEKFYDPEIPEDWWRQLPEDFATQQEKFDLSLWDSLKLNSISVSDYAFRTYASFAVLFGNVDSIRKITSSTHRKQWDFYKNPGFIKDPSTFFKKPKSVYPSAETTSHRIMGLKNAVVEELTFTSSFEPVNPGFDSEELFHGKYPASRARFIHHNDGPRPTVICLHGFVVDGYDINSYLFDVKRLFDMGLDVLLYTLPFHGPRKTHNSKFSGDGFFSIDVCNNNEHMAFSVYDLQVFIEYLKNRKVETIGMTGVSLGGYHTALMSAIDDRIDFAIPMIPFVSVIDLILEWQPAGTMIKTMLNLYGIKVEDVRHAMAVHSALSYPRRLDKDRLFIVAGTGDKMATPKHAALLWEHWNRPNIYYYGGNHLIHLERKKYLDEVEKFIRRLGI